MRVFILCTGRSGSVAFIRACQHITNFTSDHESLSNALGDARFQYPDQHIEADNRLSWQLGELYDHFGDEAFYVHLKRDPDKVAESFTRRFLAPRSVIDAFAEGIRMRNIFDLSPEEKKQVCLDYVNTVEANVRHFMSNKTNVMTIDLEQIDEQFPAFWKQIGAEGNLAKALEEFKVRHNSSETNSAGLIAKLKYGVRRLMHVFST